jgi:hypothetical protein
MTHDCCKYEKDGTEKFSFRAAKKGGKKNYPVNQNFAQLRRSLVGKVRNAITRIAIPTQNRELGWVALGKSGETVKITRYTSPSPMKTTPTIIASNSNGVSTASVSKAGDVMMTSSDQTVKLLKKKNVTPNKDPPEGKTTAIVAVMRGRPEHSHHRQCSNKHYKQIIVRVLLDSGSDGDLSL